MGCLLIDDLSFCEQISRLLQHHCGELCVDWQFGSQLHLIVYRSNLSFKNLTFEHAAALTCAAMGDIRVEKNSTGRDFVGKPRLTPWREGFDSPFLDLSTRARRSLPSGVSLRLSLRSKTWPFGWSLRAGRPLPIRIKQKSSRI